MSRILAHDSRELAIVATRETARPKPSAPRRECSCTVILVRLLIWATRSATR
ncbi:MAG TPA: hypothetical protein VJ859_06100 [Allosphingosinicella sp.]|nr:hypothetical protein [Allosphingosinicella sp.]